MLDDAEAAKKHLSDHPFARIEEEYLADSAGNPILPNVDHILQCMNVKKTSLSPACRAVLTRRAVSAPVFTSHGRFVTGRRHRRLRRN